MGLKSDVLYTGQRRRDMIRQLELELVIFPHIRTPMRNRECVNLFHPALSLDCTSSKVCDIAYVTLLHRTQQLGMNRYRSYLQSSKLHKVEQPYETAIRAVQRR